MNFKLRTKQALLSLAAVAAIIGLPAIAFAGYAPSNRPTFQCITPTNCPGANYVVFNSFTNAANYGDERPFFDGKDNAISGPGGYQDQVTVHDGQTLVLRVYIHNDANPNAIGVPAATAHNTRMQVLLPLTQKTSNFSAAAVSADNANPVTVSDTVDFVGARPFKMTFDRSQPVLITYRPNGAGDFVTNTLHSASFANDRVLNANFGDWQGCFNFAALVTFKVKVSMPELPPPPPPTPPTTPPTTVTTAGAKAPTELVNTGPGDVAALAAVATIVGTLGYRRLLARRLTD